MLQQSASGLGIDQNLQRHRAVSLRQHGFLVYKAAGQKDKPAYRILKISDIGSFLADRTNGRAYAAMLSSTRLSSSPVALCIVA